MLAAFDIGNTSIVLGLYRDERLMGCWRLSTEVHRTADEYGVLLQGLFTQVGVAASQVKGAVIACVVPPLLATFKELCQRQWGFTPLVVGPGVRTGMHIRTDNPREVGPDRIANAVAARSLYGVPAIVVDFGTALVFDAISAEGDYLGNAIAPGPRISAEALFHAAARLPRVELEAPPRPIGRNTVASLQAGLFYGYLGLLEGMLTRFQRELGGKAHVIATGDLAETFARHTGLIESVDPYLTLRGLWLIYRLNLPTPGAPSQSPEAERR